jgi:disulfide bond formation protein DsbB
MQRIALVVKLENCPAQRFFLFLIVIGSKLGLAQSPSLRSVMHLITSFYYILDISSVKEIT